MVAGIVDPFVDQGDQRAEVVVVGYAELEARRADDEAEERPVRQLEAPAALIHPGE